MPVTIQGELPLAEAQVMELWQAVLKDQPLADEEVTVRVVDRAESQRLNKEYHKVDRPTNVLTFSYEADPAMPEQKRQHDVALCLEVAQQEVPVYQLPLRDYVAWLLVHAFLHATGLDHEASPEAEGQMRERERAILTTRGFSLPGVY
jgi:probable rRNA maturation factor